MNSLRQIPLRTMKLLPLLLLAALGFAAEEAPRPNVRPDGPTPEGRANPRLPVPLSPDEQKRLREAMEKANQDPAVKEAHEQAAKAQQAAAEAQKKAREATDEAARKADPSVAPILEKVRKAMEQRQPGRQPEAQPRGEAPRQREGGNRQPTAQPGRDREEGNRQPEAQPRGEAPRQREGGDRQPDAKADNKPVGGEPRKAQPSAEPNRPRGEPRAPNPESNDRRGPRDENSQLRSETRQPGTERGNPLPGLTPDEQQRIREAMTKANAEPTVREAREAAAGAQRKAMEIAADVARKGDPSLGPLFDKMRQAGETRRPQGEAKGDRKPE